MSPRDICCPHCRTALNRERKADGIVWTCTQCGGLALNLAVLRRCLPPEEVASFWRGLQQIAGPSAPCPSCAQSLREFTVQADNRKLVLDVCKTCQIVWFDPGEFESLPEHIPLAEVASPEMDERLALLKLQYQNDLNNQLDMEANHLTGWTHAAANVVMLLVRLVLRV